MTHVKLHEIIHDDFTDYTSITDALKYHDLALYCPGVYTGAIPDDEFRRITLDVTVAFAMALHKESPRAVFCFLSDQGADQTEKSRMAFAGHKGAAEKAMLQVGLHGMCGNENPVLENKDIRATVFTYELGIRPS